MAQLLYTKLSLIQRIRKHVTNAIATPDDFPVSNNEILYYLDTAIPFVMKGQMFDNAKVTGFLDTPEAYLVTYNITPLTQNKQTLESYGTLPQTPLALPMGYQIADAYFIDDNGKSNSIIFIKPKTQPYRNLLPAPAGVFGRIEGDTIFIKGTAGQPLFTKSLYVTMPVSRTTDVNAVMDMPDDSIEAIFKNVVAQLMQRYGVPQDILVDNLPAGNKSS